MPQPTNPATASLGSFQPSELGLLATVAAIATALCLAIATSYAQGRQASRFLVQGEAQVLFSRLKAAVKEAPAPPSQQVLLQVLEESRAAGLLYVALVRRDGVPVLAAGKLQPGEGGLMRLSPGDVRTRDGLATGLSEPLPPRHRQQQPAFALSGEEPFEQPLEPGFPPPGRPPGPGHPFPEPFQPPPPAGGPLPEPAGPTHHLLIQFTPVLANRVLDSARTTLAVGGLAFVALILSGLWAGRLMRHRDALVRRLEHERHLGALGEMSAVLAHEIRNPLASLKGHAQLLAAALAEESPQRAKANRVVAETLRLEKLTTDLLSFVRSGSVEPVEVDPAKLLREIAAGFEGARVQVHLAGAPERWRFDPDRIRQVLLNLLENALQASGDAAPAEVSVRVGSGALLFEVRDHGPGIPPGDEQRIFEPFYTRKARGTGLGLAVANRIVAQHGGTLTALNHPEGGALFRASIPRS